MIRLHVPNPITRQNHKLILFLIWLNCEDNYLAMNIIVIMTPIVKELNRSHKKTNKQKTNTSVMIDPGRVVSTMIDPGRIVSTISDPGRVVSTTLIRLISYLWKNKDIITIYSFIIFI